MFPSRFQNPNTFDKLNVSNVVSGGATTNPAFDIATDADQYISNVGGQFSLIRSALLCVEWAAKSVDAGGLLDLPKEFGHHRIHPWR
jgi:hypothetical protein